MVALLAVALTGCDPGADDDASPTAPTSRAANPQTAPSGASSTAAPIAAEPQPVWWDADGLHHGDVVEETAFPLAGPDVNGYRVQPHLALVRTGALYRTPRSGDVWFDPWDGEPRVVGHATVAGPGGDPEGDTAAWFDGRRLVVYDTRTGTVVSRTREVAPANLRSPDVEHVGHGTGWVHVSADEVVWWWGEELARRDLRAGTTEPSWHPVPSDPSARRLLHAGRPRTPEGRFDDVSATTAVWSVARGRGANRARLLVDHQGARTRTMAADELPAAARLSPDGSWLLTPEGADGTHGVAVMDVRTGEAWKPFRRSTYVVYSWAYGDVAMFTTLFTSGRRRAPGLFACRASQQTCVELPTRGTFGLPNP